MFYKFVKGWKMFKYSDETALEWDIGLADEV